jgi:hypothetical protein
MSGRLPPAKRPRITRMMPMRTRAAMAIWAGPS